MLLQDFLRDHGLGLAMAEIPRRRTDQLGDLVAVLELSAVNFDHGAVVAEEDLSRGLDQASLAGAGGSEKQQVGDGPAGSRKACLVYLEHAAQASHGAFLSHHALEQSLFKISDLWAVQGRIEHCLCTHATFSERRR